MSPKAAAIWLIPLSLVAAFILDNLEIPEALAPYRPEFTVAVVLYWTLQTARAFGLLIPWLAGIIQDVHYATPLGQHALAIALCAFLILQFNDWLRNLTGVQQAILMFPIFFLYELTLFCIDGISGQSTDWLWRWAPALTTPLVWPFISSLLVQAATPSREE